MARSRITLPVTPAVAPETLSESTARYVKAQARDAIAAGMGMSDFFHWGANYVMGRIGLNYSEGQSIVISAWSTAYDERRIAELDAMKDDETSAFWFAREKHYNALASACATQDAVWSQHRRDTYQCGRRARDIQDLYGR